MDVNERQRKLEKDANTYSYNRLVYTINKQIQYGHADELTEGKVILHHSLGLVTKKLKEYFNNQSIKGKASTTRRRIAHEFGDSPRELAYILLVTLVRTISKDAYTPVTHVVRHINQALYQSILVRNLENKAETVSAFVDRQYKRRGKHYTRKKKAAISKKNKDLGESNLTVDTLHIGVTLLNILVQSGANIIEIKNIVNRNRKVKHVVYTDECFKMIIQSREALLLDYKKYPIFVAPPKEWKKFEGSGGYYMEGLYKIPIIKTYRESRRMLREFFKKSDVKMLYDTLNKIQATPWRVNKRVLEVMDRVLSDNMVDPDSSFNNPYLIGKLPFNEHMEVSDFVNPNSFGKLHEEGEYKGLPVDKDKMKKYFRACDAQYDINVSTMSKALMMNYVVYNAREYADEEEIYFSYQYDFRGRIYPIQQHLQPQGKGDVKALLEFRNGYKIETPEQLFWFRVHGANCYGHDKLPYDERVAKIIEMEPDIENVSTDPFKYRNVWKDADDPYMFLAWCFEYNDYMQHPSEFESHLPISLDATCSGIQIYSGLLKDKQGAQAVNVIGDTRQDIYQEVADKVNSYLLNGEYPKYIEYKTSDGKVHTQDTKALVDSIKGKITRKLTKRNTMTQPYSVTRYGMYEQLKAELEEIENNNKKFWVGDIWVMAKLLTDLNERAIGETVKGATIGQKFLKEVTADLVKEGSHIFYTTPITKFPVLQKIHKTKSESIFTAIGQLSIRSTTDELHTQKMINGIAPNYVHSMDASLLALTVQKLSQAGCKDFHLIHDSYGVPITYVTELNKAVREAYVEIFEGQPLERWLSQVYKAYPKSVEEVMVNDLELKEVLESKYIFS